MDISKFVGEDKSILDKLYENPLNDELSREKFDFQAYLALEPTEGYKNNQDRIKREQDEAKGIFTYLSTPKREETEETKTEIKIDE